jgi:periplasmic divalent cation tolerance protein
MHEAPAARGASGFCTPAPERGSGVSVLWHACRTVHQLAVEYKTLDGLHTVTGVILVLTTMPDDDRADALARTLVDERLAACVNVHGPMTSVYRWKGQVGHDPECQLVVKTTRDRLAALEARLRALHPYELPEFIVVSVDDGSTAYLQWVADGTKSG